MTESAPQHLRVLIANERAERLERVAGVVVSLGHTVIARELNVDEVGQVTREERPDVALVGLGESSEHALEHISQIVREAACPVIALLGTTTRTLSARRRSGVSSAISRTATGRSFRERSTSRCAASPSTTTWKGRSGAGGDRARQGHPDGATGNDNAAFEMLRDHSQHTGRKLFDIAQAVLDSHRCCRPIGSRLPPQGERAGAHLERRRGS